MTCLLASFTWSFFSLIFSHNWLLCKITHTFINQYSRQSICWLFINQSISLSFHLILDQWVSLLHYSSLLRSSSLYLKIFTLFQIYRKKQLFLVIVPFYLGYHIYIQKSLPSFGSTENLCFALDREKQLSPFKSDYSDIWIIRSKSKENKHFLTKTDKLSYISWTLRKGFKFIKTLDKTNSYFLMKSRERGDIPFTKYVKHILLSARRT